MSNIFEIRSFLNKTVAETLFSQIEENTDLIVVDVGARNGMHQSVIPNEYAKRSRLVGFEPNPEEYRKLKNDETDAKKAGAKMATFKSVDLHPFALWNDNKSRSFFITQGTGACTLMGHAKQSICERMWLDGDVDNHPYSYNHTDVVKTLPVACKRLDEVFGHEDLIDILKIDAEGGEGKVLDGCRSLLEAQSILMIKTEFLLTPYFERSTLLGHQQVFLDKFGYRMIGFDLVHSTYSRSPTPIHPTADRRLIYAGDAYFILDPDTNTLGSQKLYRLGLACLALGFY